METSRSLHMQHVNGKGRPVLLGSTAYRERDIYGGTSMVIVEHFKSRLQERRRWSRRCTAVSCTDLHADNILRRSCMSGTTGKYENLTTSRHSPVCEALSFRNSGGFTVLAHTWMSGISGILLAVGIPPGRTPPAFADATMDSPISAMIDRASLCVGVVRMI